MLILTRYEGESIMLAQGLIEVKFLEWERGRARIGIEAPDEIDIVRRELWLRKREMKALEDLR